MEFPLLHSFNPGDLTLSKTKIIATDILKRIPYTPNIIFFSSGSARSEAYITWFLHKHNHKINNLFLIDPIYKNKHIYQSITSALDQMQTLNYIQTYKLFNDFNQCNQELIHTSPNKQFIAIGIQYQITNTPDQRNETHQSIIQFSELIQTPIIGYLFNPELEIHFFPYKLVQEYSLTKPIIKKRRKPLLKNPVNQVQ